MNTISLGSLQVPVIGLGTYQLTGNEAIDILLNAFQIGYRLIDTAQFYHNEDEVGKAIQLSGLLREDFMIITKVWPSNFEPDRFLSSVKESLKKLKTDHVDLLLIHWPHSKLEVHQYIHFLSQAKELGMAKEIGVSNYNISQLEAVQYAGITIVTNEIEYHPWVDQEIIMHWMQQHKMPAIAYTPLGRGMMMKDKTILSLAQEYQRSPAQIILRWMVQKQNVIAIPKASSSEHLFQNFNLFDFTLTVPAMEIIDTLSGANRRIVGAQPGAHWD